MWRLVVCGAIALLAGGSAASAQIVELSGGASTAFDAEGASIHVRTANLDTQLGMGVASGRFAAGGAMVRTLKGGSVTLGQQELKADVPTDVFDTRHTLFGTGIGIRRESAGSSLVAFTGFTSLRSGTPLFQAEDLGKLSHFTQWRSHLGTGCGQTVTAMSGSSTVALASVDCSPVRWLTWAATLGMGAGAPYAAGSAVLRLRDLDVKAAYILASDRFQRSNNPQQPTPEPVRENITATYRVSRALHLSASHGNWTMPSPSDSDVVAKSSVVEKSSMDTGGVGWEHGNLGASAAVIRSHFQDGGGTLSGTTEALSGSLRYRAGKTEWTETLLHSKGSAGVNSTIVSTTASIQPSARLRLSEGLNFTDGGVTLSHGGTLLTRWSSFDVDYQFYYVANRPDRPFQQALLLRADLQLPGRFSVSAVSTVSPTGAPLYTFKFGRVLTREHTARSVSLGAMGQGVVRGHVEEQGGVAVARAALRIGNDRVYTDESGNFLWRGQRSRTLPLRVLTDEFVSADVYVVVDAPMEVRGGDAAPLSIVVRRERGSTTPLPQP